MTVEKCNKIKMFTKSFFTNLKFKPHLVPEFLVVWVGALVLNFIWENMHAVLYVHYQGGVISDYILLRASVFDAFIIVLFATLGRLFLKRRVLKKEVLIFSGIAIVFAIGLEKWALATSRWQYQELMPLIPLLKVGWSPVVQLFITGSLAIILARILHYSCSFCSKYDEI